jgi:predicted nuclease with RNAse H fold
LVRAPRLRAAARAWAASRRASRIERAIARPALALSAITSSVRRPVRRASVREIIRTVLPIWRERSQGARGLAREGRKLSGRLRRPGVRVVNASTASDG